MADDLHANFQRLQPATYNAPLTSLSQLSFSRDNDQDSIFRSPNDERLDNLRTNDLSAVHSLPIRPKNTTVRKNVAIPDDNYVSTPPIDVPASSSQDDLPFSPQALPLNGSPYTPSPLEDFLRNRRTLITFNSQVTLESGQRRRLEEPLPKRGIDTRLRRQPVLQDLSRHTPGSCLARAYGEAERSTGEPTEDEPAILDPLPLDLQEPELLDLEEPEPPDLEEPEPPALVNQPHYLLVPSQGQGLSSGKGLTDLEERVSLTSGSSSSSILSEIKTPKDDIVASIVPPRSTCAPFHPSASLQEMSTWPILSRPNSAPRAKSYSFNRKGDIRQGFRRRSPRSTASSHSPASAFLSRFSQEEIMTAPDDEGQEVGEYVLGRQIGFGGSSVVKEAFTIEGDTRLCRAVKIVRKIVANKEDLENERFQAELEREVGLWRCLSHRHILSLIAVHVTPFATFCFTPLSNGGSLFDLVRVNRQGLRGDLARRYSYQLASAVRYLHEDMRVVHRDIKLENCLVHLSNADTRQDGGDLLLCDFGLAEFEVNDHSRGSPDPYGQSITNASLGLPATSTSFVGSLEYASPELILGPPGFFSRVIDIWALGVVIYALHLGDLPFQHPLPSRVQQKILAGEWNADALRQAMGAAGTEEVLETVQGCLNMRSEERWVISQVLGSRWLNGCSEMLDELSRSWTR